MLVHDYLLRSARTAGEKTALIHGQRRFSYTFLAEQSLRFSSWLQAEGLAVGDRAIILSDDPFYYITCYFAILQAGGIAVGMNTQTSERTVSDAISDCSPRLFLVSGRSSKYRDTIEGHPTPPRLMKIEQLESEAGDGRKTQRFRPPAIDPENIAQIIYTSGTTGKPKGVMLRHRNLTANTDSIIDYLGMEARDRGMAVLPFFYSYGNSVMLTHIAAGATLVVNQNFLYPNLILEQMSAERVTGLSGVPSTFAILLHRSAARDYSFPHLRYLTQAGAAMSPKLAGQLKQLFPHSDIYIMYGQTEAAPRLSYLAPEDLLRKPGSIGKAIPGVTLAVLRRDATPAAVQETGEIAARGDNIMAGYWQRPEESAEALRQGWLWTGDLGYCDEDGYYYLVSRKSDMIKSGSHRIAPGEIEEIICELDGVAEAAVVGQKDDILGEALVAYVVLKSEKSLTTKDIISFCRKNLPLFKVPQRIIFLNELPRSESGKIRKKDLGST